MKEEKRKLEEYKKNPTINLADSINRSMIGDPRELTKGSGITRAITALVITGILAFLYLCSH